MGPRLESSPQSWLASLCARPLSADVALAKLCVLARMLADRKLDTLLGTMLRRLGIAS